MVPGCNEASEDDTAFLLDTRAVGRRGAKVKGSSAARQLRVVLVFLGSRTVPLTISSRLHNDTAWRFPCARLAVHVGVS